jgi:hypothetical protein
MAEHALKECNDPQVVKQLQHVIMLKIRILKLEGAKADSATLYDFAEKTYPRLVDDYLAGDGLFAPSGWGRFVEEFLTPAAGGLKFTKGSLMQATKPSQDKPFKQMPGKMIWDTSKDVLASFKKFMAVWVELLDLRGKPLSGTGFKDHLEKVKVEMWICNRSLTRNLSFRVNTDLIFSFK